MKLYLRIFFLVFVTVVICTGELKAEKIQGYYISKSNDTTKVTFDIPMYLTAKEPYYENLQQKVTCYDLVTNQKQILNPYTVKEISFNFKGDNIKMLSRKEDLELKGNSYSDDSRIFLHLIKDGKLKLFRFYETPSGDYRTIQLDIMQKNNEELFVTRALSFKKDMVDYLLDCPELAKKIDEKIYKKKDIEQIIDEYNRTCK